MATLLLLPMAAVPAFFGIWLWNRPLAAFLALIGFAGCSWRSTCLACVWLRSCAGAVQVEET